MSAYSLSAALADEATPMAIDPQLQSDSAQADSTGEKRASEFDSSDPLYPGFANSAAREEERTGWGYEGDGATGGEENAGENGSANERAPLPWEEGYRDPDKYQLDSSAPFPDANSSLQALERLSEHQRQDNLRSDEDGAEETQSKDGVKSRKRPRVSRGPRANKEHTGKDIKDIKQLMEENEGELEYEDTVTQDPKLGPVFIHPPPSAAQACVRCHRIKRKCDNARPRCAGCNKADVPCVFELSPATSSFVKTLKTDNADLIQQISMAHVRIAELESSLSNKAQGQSLQINDAPQIPLTMEQNLDEQADFPALARKILSVRSSAMAPNFGAISADALQADRRALLTSAQSAQSHSSAVSSGSYPPFEVAQEAVEKFYLCNAISYPFLDKNDFMRDMDEAYARANSKENGQPGPLTSPEEEDLFKGKEFILFMVIAIGTTNRERMGEVERGSSKVFRDRAMKGLQAAISREDISCVQSLILLGIYSMFDPSGISLWHVVGFAARIAIALNLHRRVDDASLPVSFVEHRKRVFYSLYNLDRLVATTLSKPLAISDDDIDNEFPSVQASDSPYRGIPRIVFTEHIIKLRRLSGNVLTTVYSVSGRQNLLPEPERANIITELHGRLDSWLAQCPVPPENEQEKRGMINNHSWFALNYHHCICLLYRPSPLYPITTADRLRALHEASTRCVDLHLELWHEAKLSYNLINISSQFLACISLLYCLCEYDNRSPELAKDVTWRREVSTRLGQCHELLENFGRALPETAKYREIFGKLSEMLLARHGPLPQGDAGNSTSGDKPSTVVKSAPAEVKDINAVASKPIPQTTSDAASDFLASLTGLKNPPLANVDVSNGSGGLGNDNASAWNAMTRLWYNSGDFQFDEDILGQINDRAAAGGPALDLNTIHGQLALENGKGKQKEKDGQPAVSNLENHSYGNIGNMLWNQTG